MKEFRAMSAKEKLDTVCDIRPYLDEAAEGLSFYQKVLAQGLFVTRVHRFFAELLAKLGKTVPVLMEDALALLWQWLLGETEEVEAFRAAAESVLIYLLVDDDDGLDQAAWEQYRKDWDDNLCYNTCLESATAAVDVLRQIASGEVTWYEMNETELPASIGHFICDFGLEPVFRKADGCYTPAEADRQALELYDCASFARIMGLLLADIGTARGVTDRAEADKLRDGCEPVFNGEQIDMIAKVLRDAYKL